MDPEIAVVLALEGMDFGEDLHPAEVVVAGMRQCPRVDLTDVREHAGAGRLLG